MPDAIDDESPARLVADLVIARRSEILRRYTARLAGPGDEGQRRPVPDRLIEQAIGVLDELCRRLAGAPAQPDLDVASLPGGDAPNLPSPDSLRAAGELFRAVLQTIAADLPGPPAGVSAMASLAAATHESIVSRLTVAASGYAGYLLDRLHRSHVDERRRVARELHDLIAHAVAVALQDLELFVVRREQHPDRAEAKLDAAIAGLRDTLDMLRAITQDLRRSAAESGLTAALRSYLETRPYDQRTELEVLGDDSQVSPAVQGELFLVLREALRNAHLHAVATAVRVRIEIGSDAVLATVSDDGRGFDPTAPAGRTAGTGLASMGERIALLGGAIEVRSTPGRGTSVSVRVPIMRAWDDGED